MNKVILHNVIDTRTNQFHSTAIVKETNLKYFVSADTFTPISIVGANDEPTEDIEQ